MPADPQPRTIPEALHRAADRYGDDEALVDGTTRLSFRDVAEQVEPVARALVASGVEQGDRVALWAPNSAIWAITSFAVYAVGAVLVPLNTRYRGEEAGHVLRTSGARLLFATTDLLGSDLVALLDDQPALEALEEIVVLEGPPRPGSPTRRRVQRPGHRRARSGGGTPPGGRDRGRRVRHHLHLGHHRQAQGGRAGARRQCPHLPGLVRAGGSAQRRPLPRRLSVLPHGGTEVRHAGLRPAWRDDPPPRRVRRRPGHGACGIGTDHHAAGATDRLSVDPQSSGFRVVRPVLPASLGDRSRRRPGGRDPPHARRAALRDRRHRLRPDRDHGHGQHVPP